MRRSREEVAVVSSDATRAGRRAGDPRSTIASPEEERERESAFVRVCVLTPARTRFFAISTPRPLMPEIRTVAPAIFFMVSLP